MNLTKAPENGAFLLPFNSSCSKQAYLSEHDNADLRYIKHLLAERN